MGTQPTQVKPHIAEVLEIINISDTAISICAACCGKVGATLAMPIDPATGQPPEDTRSWHTISEVHSVDEAEIQRQIKWHLANVEAKHMGRDIGRRFAQALVGKKSTDL